MTPTQDYCLQRHHGHVPSFLVTQTSTITNTHGVTQMFPSILRVHRVIGVNVSLRLNIAILASSQRLISSLFSFSMQLAGMKAGGKQETARALCVNLHLQMENVGRSLAVMRRNKHKVSWCNHCNDFFHSIPFCLNSNILVLSAWIRTRNMGLSQCTQRSLLFVSDFHQILYIPNMKLTESWHICLQ